MVLNALGLMTCAVSLAEVEKMICRPRPADTPDVVACSMNAHFHRIVDLQGVLLLD